MHANAFATYVMGYAMKTMMFETRRRLAGAGLLCAALSWGDPAPDPTGPMSEYLVHCHSWMAYSAEACGRLADRLADVETPTRAERLALHKARVVLGREADDCPGVAAIAADHPDYAYALYFLSDCVPWKPDRPGGEAPAVALLERAAAIEPDNYLVLDQLLFHLEEMHPAADVDAGTLAAYREALYGAGMARAAWWRTVLKDAEPDNPPTEDFLQWTIWEGPLVAALRIYAAAMRNGDLDAAEAVQARLRGDLELDALDYGAEHARASLALVCQPSLYAYLGIEDVCLEGVEKLSARASAAGLSLPGYVLETVDHAAGELRRVACAASKGVDLAGSTLAIRPGECLPESTETPAVRRLQAVLENHGGPWSSEHHRVLAQGFLGGDNRLEGLRTALRVDAGNDRARCELVTALAARGDTARAAGLGGDPECLERADFAWGDIGSPKTRVESTD